VWGKGFAGIWLVATLVALTCSTGASACSCAPRTPTEALREADGAVVGLLVKVVPHGPLRAVYRYRVLHVYKGADAIEAGQMLSVRGARRAAACALPRRTGLRYGLFLERHHGRWFGGICGVVLPARMRDAAQHRPRVYRRAAGSQLCAA
jgi:hypothetical protein